MDWHDWRGKYSFSKNIILIFHLDFLSCSLCSHVPHVSHANQVISGEADIALADMTITSTRYIILTLSIKHYIKVKNQNCRKLYIWVSKPIRRKIQNQRKKNQLNRTYQLGEKSKKPPENVTFMKNSIFGWFFGYFS